MALPPRIADQTLAAFKLPEGTGAGLDDAARAFRELWDSQNSSQPFGMAVTTYLAAREDLRKNTRDSRLDFRRREQFRCLAEDQPQAVILDRAIRHFRPLERAGQQLASFVARLAQLETPANQWRCDFPGRAAEKADGHPGAIPAGWHPPRAPGDRPAGDCGRRHRRRPPPSTTRHALLVVSVQKRVHGVAAGSHAAGAPRRLTPRAIDKATSAQSQDRADAWFFSIVHSPSPLPTSPFASRSAQGPLRTGSS